MNKTFKTISFWILIFVVAWYISNTMSGMSKEREIQYSEFKILMKAGKLEKVVIRPDIIKGEEITKDGKSQKFRTVPVLDMDLVKELSESNVEFKGEPEKSWFSNALWAFGPILLLGMIWYFMIRQMQGGGKQIMSFARSKAKMQSNKKEKITFQDVAGCDEAKEELKEIIDFLKDPKKFQKLGGRIPKGVLLYGAPGTGKTLLAKAVSGEAGVPFFSSSGSEFVEMFVGVGAARVRDLFEQGKKNAPCLLFVDEIDAVGRHRFSGIGGGHDEREQTLNQILVEMDGFDTKEGVILIAATNRPDVLDPALLRPGRFDRHVNVPAPDLNGREEILRIHTKVIKIAEGVDLKTIARRTPGFVGSDLANLANEAALLAARRNLEAVTMPELEEAIDRVIAGPERKSRMISDPEKKIIAYHESGHTLIAKMIPNSDPVHKVSIMPRGPALGYTLQIPLEDKYLTTKQEIMDKMAVLLGGRAAEEIIFGEITTGAQNDIMKATEMAYRMVCEFGMSNKIGPVAYKKKDEELFLGRDIVKEKGYSEKTAQEIDAEIKSFIDQAMIRAHKILEDNKEKLKKLAEKLIEKEMLAGEEVEQLLNGSLKKDEKTGIKEAELFDDAKKENQQETN